MDREQLGAPAARREIRVIRVAAAEARTRTELDRLSDPKEGPKAIPNEQARRRAVIEKQEYLRTLILRRRRIAEIVGESFVPQGDSSNRVQTNSAR